MLFSAWAWNIICAPDVFTWNFAFMLMNMAQVFHILYQLRPVKFDPELEEAYHALFEPFKVKLGGICYFNTKTAFQASIQANGECRIRTNYVVTCR